MANKAEVNARRAIAKGRRKAGSKDTDNAVNAILAGARANSPAPAIPDGEKGVKEHVGDFLNTPAIKIALDALSVGTYASANVANEVVNAAHSAKDGDVMGTIGGLVSAPVEGIVKGLSGAIGNEEHATTFSKVIDNATGGDYGKEGGEKAAKAILGFAGDVALDPLTYATFGAAPAIKGGVKAAQEAGVANRAAKLGKNASAVDKGTESISKVSAFKKGYKETKQAFDLGKKEDAEFKRAKRQLRSKTSDEQAQWLEENVLGLRPAVATKVVKEVEKATEAQAKLASKPRGDKGDLSAAIDAPKIIDDAIVTGDRIKKLNLLPEVGPAGPSSAYIAKGTTPARLGETKPPTIEAQVLDRISDVRASVPPPKAADGAPTGGKLKADDIDFDAFDKFIRVAGKTNAPLETKKGTVKGAKKIALDFIQAKGRGDNETMTAIVNFLSPTHTDSFVRAAEEVVGESAEAGTTGNIRAISKDIRAGKIDAKQFEDLAGTSDPKQVAKFLDAIVKSPEFKLTDKQMRSYNTGSRLGISQPETGISGHALLALPSERYSAKDILASKTPATEAEASAFLEAKYTEVATELSRHKMGPELRTIADDVFYSAVGVQKLPGGVGRTLKGASSNGPGEGAKFEKLWNTHANMYPIKHIVMEARKLAPKNPSLRDDIIMTVLRDVDNRLRLAGIDPHLSNMRVVGEKTIIRLSPSDVFDAMPKSARMKYLWGTGKDGAINELLPTSVLDVAEVLVRSITKLNPDGTPDFTSAIHRAMDAISGTTGSKYGTRTIGKNLDDNVVMKDWESVILNVVGRDSDTFKKFQKAKLYADKEAVFKALEATQPAKVADALMLRMDAKFNGLLKTMTAGFKEGKPSVLSDLIATNMRNASVHSGNVSRRIVQLSAEHSERIMQTFNNGTPTEYLNDLVVHPPYPHNGKIDPAIFKIREELKYVVQSATINGHEAKHLNAIGDVTKLSKKKHTAKESAARNAKSYQELDETKVLSEVKPKDITPAMMDNAFDIAVREANIDVLYRAFGPSRFFNKRAGIGRSFESIAGSAHAATHLMTGFHNVMRTWVAKGITKEQARVAFKEIQSSMDSGIPLSPFAQEMQEHIKFMFSADPNVNNFLTRNTVGPSHFNKVLGSIMDNDEIRVPVDATPEEMAMAWKDWNIENPIDFFSKMQRAMVKTAEDVSMGASFSAKFGKPTKQPGYVRVVDSSNSNEFIPLIDQDLYYPKEVVDEIPFISKLMTDARTFKPGTNLHTFVTRVFDPVISNLKMTQTTLKPGHHVMSVTGDALRNSLAGMGGSTKEYGQMWRILHTQFGEMKGQDAMDKWANVKNVVHSVDVGKNTNQRYETLIVGGKKVKVAHKDIYGIMQQKGTVLPPHLGGVDVDEMADFDQFGKTGNTAINAIDKVTSTLDRVANPNHGKYSLNNFTAHRDSLMRGALFMHFLQSKSFKSLDEAAEFASEQVRKWSPTSADLGAFEAKYARRVFMYYTWLRGMLPRVIEGTLIKPGVAMVPSKAMYNLAQANGIDPSSIGDPFPEGSLFPSWYSEKVIGPQWESEEGDLWGINPTSPVLDVMNSLGSNVSTKDLLTGAAIPKVSGTLLNMATPWAKTPAELITGKTLDGGRPIEDNSVYLTDQIGPARVASRVIGKDLIPSLDPEGGIGFANRPEAKFEAGLGADAGPNAYHELINWALGMGATNYTSDSAVNSAKYEQKEALKEEKEQYLRYGN